MRAHGFCRAHRHALIPLAGVRELKWTGGGALIAVLSNGVEIAVSRRRRAAFAAAVRAQTHRQSRVLHTTCFPAQLALIVSIVCVAIVRYD